MTIDRTRQGTIATYGKYPANLIMGLYAPGWANAAYHPALGLFESNDIISFTTGSNLAIATVYSWPAVDIVTNSSQTIYSTSITNTASTPIISITTHHVKPIRKQIIVPYGNVFLANIEIAASNNTSGDTTYFTPYLTLNYVANGVVTNIVPRTQVYANSTGATSNTAYGMMMSYVIPNDIVIPVGARIQLVIEVDGYVNAGTGSIYLQFSSGSTDLSGNPATPAPGTWFSLPVLVE